MTNSTRIARKSPRCLRIAVVTWPLLPEESRPRQAEEALRVQLEAVAGAPRSGARSGTCGPAGRPTASPCGSASCARSGARARLLLVGHRQRRGRVDPRAGLARSPGRVRGSGGSCVSQGTSGRNAGPLVGLDRADALERERRLREESSPADVAVVDRDGPPEACTRKIGVLASWMRLSPERPTSPREALLVERLARVVGEVRARGSASSRTAAAPRSGTTRAARVSLEERDRRAVELARGRGWPARSAREAPQLLLARRAGAPGG